MSEKKGIEKKQVKETTAKKKNTEGVETLLKNETKQEVEAGGDKVEEPVLASIPTDEEAAEKVEVDAQLSSLEMLWRHGFGEIDEWAKRADFRDEVLIKEAKFFAESVQRNQGNVVALAVQFYQELSAWERTAREEFLMSTTSLQHFFPLKSYEEINTQIDHFQEKTISILATPFETLASNIDMEKYLEMIDHYIAVRKKGRQQYIKTVKQAGNLIYENQKGFVNLFARQIRTLLFPFNKYMEKAEELIKS